MPNGTVLQSGDDEFLPPPESARAAWCYFDAAWYLAAYAEVGGELAKMDFVGVRRHYIDHGRKRGYSPNMVFDEHWYRRRYRDVAAAIEAGVFDCGYLHYCGSGYTDRSPHWLYDEETYAAASPDLTTELLAAAGCINRYDHYLKSGAREGRIGHLLFDPGTYRAQLGETGDAADIDPQGAFGHFLARMWRERLDAETSIYFDPTWYLTACPDARIGIETGVFVCALQAYLVAEPPACSPRAEFDEAYYLMQNPDVAALVAAGHLLSGYEHFLKRGVFELRAPAPGINLAAFAGELAEAISAGEVRCAFEHLLRHAGSALPGPPVAVPDASDDLPNNLGAPLARPEDSSEAASRGRGHVDFYGYHMPSRAWFFCGWVTTERLALDTVAVATAYFEHGQFSGESVFASHRRDDIGGIGLGVVMHMPGVGGALGGLISIGISIAGQDGQSGAFWTITPAHRAPQLRDQALGNAVLPVIGQLASGSTKTRLTALAARRGYTGSNTLGELRNRVFLEIDEAILCAPDGLALVGWALHEPGQLRSIRVQSGHLTTELRLDSSVRVDRNDVHDSVGAPQGLGELRCGFVAYLPNAVLDDEPTYLEIETMRGDIAHRGIPKPRLRGMQAIRFLLDRVDLRYAEVAPAFDAVFGPAVTALNVERLREAPQCETVAFGRQPDLPVLSVIVTLFGRLDFMEYQFAFLSRSAPGLEVEFIYVLDEPARKREAEALAASIHERFRIPLRLVALSRNLGYGPANNVGLGLARGEFVCFLNSDVFAGSADWMARLVDRLRDDSWLGAVGPLLLFEDECVQHQGMAYERLAEFAAWRFPVHPRKGWRRPAAGGLQSCLAITGACLMMKADLARQLGGFDEAFIIGDFEDSDLCLKLRRRGLSSAVDMDVFLYHLERQSQAGSQHRWRMNLTLCNAWTHERRWGDTLARIERVGAGDANA